MKYTGQNQGRQEETHHPIHISLTTSSHCSGVIGHDSGSNHRRPDYLFNRLFRRRSKTTSKLRVTDLCEGNPPVTGEFPSQRASDAENVSIWWRHHVSLAKVSHKMCFSKVPYMLDHEVADLWEWIEPVVIGGAGID